MDKLSEGRVLLVGEGDFSFSFAFAKHLSSNDKVNITSSCLLTREEVENLHGSGQKNVTALQKQGVKILFSTDATKLEHNKNISCKFDRIIFNFPHVGGKSNIKKNRQLVKDFFKSAVRVLSPGGDICVSFCRGQGGTPADDPVRAWYDSWQSVAAATYSGLILQELWPFSAETYPEYSSTGFRSLDKSFYTGDGSLTYVFRRCEPLIAPSSSLSLLPGTLCINAREYRIRSQYVAAKFNRRLHNEKGHPISLTCHHILQSLSKSMKMSIREIPEPSPVLTKMEKTPLAYSVSELDDGLHKGDQMLRRSLLDHLRDDIVLSNLEMDHMHSVSGNVCRVRPCIESNDLPVKHELLLILRNNDSTIEEGFSVVRKHVTDSLKEVLGSEKHLLVTQNVEGLWEWTDPFPFSLDSLYVIEVSYKSSTIPVTNACNQVGDTGPAKIPPKSTSKSIKISRQIGFLARSSDCILGLINLEVVAMTKYDIPDARLMWSQDAAFLRQFSNLDATVSYKYCPISLYPPLWRHDISLWESKDASQTAEGKFDEQGFFDIVREVCGDAAVRVLLVNKWAEPVAGRVSRCYRVVYQSYDRAVSHEMAHDIQNCARRSLEDTMDIELR